MLSYKTILDRGLMDKSVADVLIGANDKERQLNLDKTGVNRLAYNICHFYAVLIQAYYITLAYDSETTIYQIPESVGISDTIKKLWVNKNQLDFSNKGSVFSFVIECSKKCSSDVIRNKNEIIELISFIRYLLEQGRQSIALDDESLLLLLDSFELLKKCKIEENTLVFESEGEKVLRTSTTPYLFFSRATGNGQRKTYIFVSALQGERNQEIIAKAVELNSKDKEPRTYSKRLNISEREDMRAICRALGIDTNWYSVDDCWCDLAFLIRILEVTESVLKTFWHLGKRQRKIQGKLKELYKDSDLYHKIDLKEDITQNQIDSFLYKFFIENGVFRSMYGLFLDMSENKYSFTLYTLFKEELVRQGILLEEEMQKMDEECSSKINEHLNRLRRMVPENTERYHKREREIKAEWRSFTILRAAGIHTDNLFADREKFLSIDDYYQMMNYSEDTALTDLESVLRFLCSFYEPLYKNTVPLDENKLIEDVDRSKKELKELDLFALFDRFAEIARISRTSMISEKLLGREEGICEFGVILNYKTDIERYLAEDPKTEEKRSEGKSVFVSYCHKNQEEVTSYVRDWQSKGINVFFDEDKFKGGDNWREKARKEIRSPECAVVFAFVSTKAFVSPAVKFELSIAKDIHKQIIFINLEDEPICEYLDRMVLNPDETIEGSDKYPHWFDDTFNFDGEIYYNKNQKEEILERIRDYINNNTDYSDADLILRDFRKYETCIAHFYAYLKTGQDEDCTMDQIDEVFASSDNISHCVYPLVVSVKETKIKRDNITIIGYEIINSQQKNKHNYILSSKRLQADDYYCIPNYRTSGDDCSWMVEPLLIPCRIFHNNS